MEPVGWCYSYDNGGGKSAYDHVWLGGGGGWNCVYPGNAPLGSGERDAVSILSTIVVSSAGLLVMNHVSGSRSVVRCWVLGPCVLEVRSEAVLRIDLSASLGFFTNIAMRAGP